MYDVVRDKKENVLTDQSRFAQLILKMAAKDYDHLFKLLIIGDSGVGKSSLLVRLVSFFIFLLKILFRYSSGPADFRWILGSVLEKLGSF